MDLGKDVQGGYSDAIRELSQDAQAALRVLSDELFAAFDGSNMAELIDGFIARGYVDVVVPFAMASAQAGAAMVAYTTDGEAEAEPEIPPFEQFESQARYYATKIDWQEGDVSKFTEGMCRAAERIISHAADNTTLGAKRRGDGDVRFARVPVGPTCGFCVMLASRGFVYKSREDAGFAGLLAFNRFHDHCDCRVYAETDGLSIEDYNPELYYRRYKACRDAVDYEYERNGDVISLLDVAYSERGGGTDYNEFVMREIVAEMDRRDRGWLNGIVDGVEYGAEDGTTPKPFEIDAAESLGANGIFAVFMPVAKENGVRSPDIRIDSDRWDIKSPVGNGNQTIYHQFDEAVGQAHKIVIDLSRTDIPLESAVDKSLKHINYTYRYKGEEFLFDEVLLISRDDRLVRIFRRP